MQQTADQRKSPVRERIDNFARKLKSRDPSFNTTTMYRTMAVLAALISMYLPWVHLDGSEGPMNGAALIAYAFTSPERSSLFSISMFGTLTLLFIPLTVLGTTGYSFIKNLQGHYTPGSNVAAAVLPIAMLLAARSIISSDQPSLLGIQLPEWGVTIMVLTHTGLLVHGLANENAQRHQR